MAAMEFEHRISNVEMIRDHLRVLFSRCHYDRNKLGSFVQ